MNTPKAFCERFRLTWLLIMLAGCGGGAGNQVSSPPPSIHNDWTWVAGSNAINQIGTYGTEGTASAGAFPGARAYPSSWTDLKGNLWLFGGYGPDTTRTSGDLNDLWEYSNGEWMWVAGSNQIEQAGTYGTKDVVGISNAPGARYQASSWVDVSGNFWIFGGLGIDSKGTRGNLNDLWKFTNGQWAWMAGSNVTDQAGIYGTRGVTDPTNSPGARVNAATWTDSVGNLWLFGGSGRDANGTPGILNDLWEYANGQWTWVSGSNLVDRLGVYGTQGTGSVANVPGARTNATGWTDASGNLWLFGGEGNDSNGLYCSQHPGPCLLNDLWEFHQGQWTWVGGSNIVNHAGNYGTQDMASASNVPGARWGTTHCEDALGNLWLFGGEGLDSLGNFGDLNDLWKYAGGQWTWISGADFANSTGSYGTVGTASASNAPVARDGAVLWCDLAGNVWLFAGEDVDIASGGKLNDLWKFRP